MSETKKRKVKRVQTTGRLEENPETEQLEEESREKFMTLGEHLEELRKRIIWMLLTLVIFSSVAGFFSFRIHEYLVAPYIKMTGLKLFLGSSYGALEMILKLSLLFGFTGGLPVIFYIAWGFVTPALSRKAAWVGNIVVAASALLFWGGMVFAWFLIFPFSLEFMFLDVHLPGTVPQITLEKYYSFLFMIIIGAGVVFQVPLLQVVLGALGILKVSWYKRTWKYAIVAIWIFAALVTPPDPISQVLVGLPLTVFYGIAIVIVWIIEKSRGEKSVDESGEETPEE